MSDVAEIAPPPPPARRAPSPPTHSNSPSLDSNSSFTSIHSHPSKPPHLRLDSTGSASSSPLTQASLSPHTTSGVAPASFSPRNSPLGRRSNIRLASPRPSILSPSQSLPSLQSIVPAADDALIAPLNRSSSNNRLSAIVSKKAGLSPIVTSTTIAPLAAAPDTMPNANVDVRQEANGTDAHSTSAATATVTASASASPPARPNPLDRPSSISLQLPQNKGLLTDNHSTISNGNNTNNSNITSSNSVNGTTTTHTAAAAVDNDGEEEAAVLTINHTVGAARQDASHFLQQPLHQPLSSASASSNSSSPSHPHDPITPITPFTPNSSALPPTTPNASADSVDAAYKDQLDGVLRRRGDSHLNLQSLDPTTGQLTVPLPLQMRQMSAIGPERRVAFRVDRTDGLDLVDLIPEEHDEAAETRLTKGWHPAMRATRGILKTVNIKGTEEERRRRVTRATEREKEWIRFVQDGSTLIKYNAQGKPQKRWVYVSEDGHEINWEKPTDQWLRPKKRWDEDDEKGNEQQHAHKHPHKLTPPPAAGKQQQTRSAGDIHSTTTTTTSASGSNSGHTTLTLKSLSLSPRPVHQHSAPAIHANDTNTNPTTSHTQHSTNEPTTPTSSQSASRSKRRSSLPSMRILNWKINPDRTRYLADVLGVHYGPYHSADRFGRFLQRKDYQTGFPWLAFTIEFPDRTLDLVGGREDEVQQWFLGVQALAPLSVHHLTMGGVLWQRLIMKLNFYGLEPIKTERISSWTSSDDGHWGY